MFPAMIGWHLVHGSMALSIVGNFPFFLFALDDVGKGLVTTTW
jgi:hypothetical protein